MNVNSKINVAGNIQMLLVGSKALYVINTYFSNFILQKRIFWKKEITKVDGELKTWIEEGYDFLEKFLVGNQYVTGNDVTIADFSIITTLNNLSVSNVNV